MSTTITIRTDESLRRVPELREAAALMKRYTSIPMDFADATPVLLAVQSVSMKS